MAFGSDGSGLHVAGCGRRRKDRSFRSSGRAECFRTIRYGKRSLKMNPFIRKIGFGVLLATLFLPLHSCGLGEDSRDEDNRYVYLRFADPAFEAYCLEHWDLNGDGRISRYEAQRVWDMDCSSLGIKTLAGIEEFTALRKPDCSGKEIVSPDVAQCIFLEQ